jgi:hypothetical protein
MVQNEPELLSRVSLDGDKLRVFTGDYARCISGYNNFDEIRSEARAQMADLLAGSLRLPANSPRNRTLVLSDPEHTTPAGKLQYR